MKIASKQIILAKIEATPGTDAVPVLATDGIYAEEVTARILARSDQRNEVQPFFGNRGSIEVGEGMEISFNVSMRGKAPLGTVPEIGSLLRACNFTQTVVASTSVTYAPNSSFGNAGASESLTLYLYLDDLFIKVTGARGDFTLDATSGQMAKMQFKFQGIYGGIVDTAPGGAVTVDNTTVPPQFVSASLSFNGVALDTSAFSLAIGNTITPLRSANSATGVSEYAITGRAVTAKFDPSIPAQATLDMPALWQANSQHPFVCTIGAVGTGNALQVSLPTSKIKTLDTKNRDGVLVYDILLDALPTTAGNDELTLTFL